MKKLLLVVILLVPGFVLAQEQGISSGSQSNQEPPSFVPTSQTSGPSGNIACFDYYRFGSVQADLQANLAQTTPGATLTFSGKVTNDNEYPLVDGKLYVKIFRRDESTFKEGNGNPIVDQFVVAEKIQLVAKGERKVSYEWKVPENARGGEYYAAYFFTTSERYNLLGLSFTDDVVGNQAQFVVTNSRDPKTVILEKNNVTLNSKQVPLAAFPLHFKSDETVTAKIRISNPSSEAKSVPVQWNQYTWDAMREENRQNTKTELVSLAPGERKELSYTALITNSSVVYIVATTQDGESKSFVNVRYVKDGIEETRINFPSLTKFPIKRGEEQTLFACAHSTNVPVVKENKLLLTLKDKNDNIITQYSYDGDIPGAMSGFGQKFTSDKDYDYVKMEASLYRDGNEMEKVEVVYDCQVIDPSLCSQKGSDGDGFFTGKMLIVGVIALTGLIVLVVAVVVMRRRDRPVQW
jgi:hypothetical protein